MVHQEIINLVALHLKAGNIDVGMALLERSRDTVIAKGSPHERDFLRRVLKEQAGGLREAGFRELADSLDGTARTVPMSPPGESPQRNRLAVRFPSESTGTRLGY
jgi:hypothetical protein